MKRLGLLLLACLALAGLLPTPARSASVQFADPAGDATELFGPGGTPRPNDAELDLLSVEYASRSGNLILSSRITKFGTPSASLGSIFRWDFIYNGVRYSVSAQLPADGSPILSQGVYFFSETQGPTDTGPLDCDRCALANDVAANTVRAVLPLSSMSRGIRNRDPSQPVLRRGSTFTEIYSRTSRYAGLSHGADSAVPPPGTTFTL